MHFTTPTAALIAFLAATTTLAAPVPHHHHHHHHEHENNGQTALHRHKHHHEGPLHRVTLWTWLNQHIHYPHHWPFHPHHHHVEQTPEDRENKQSGAMLRFWLHSHFGPHTSKLRSHRGRPLVEQSQQVFTSSQFDSKPDRHRDKRSLLEARHLEDDEESEHDESHHHEEGGDHEEALKDMHKELAKIDKHTSKQVDKHLEKAMHEAQALLKEAVEGMHLHLGMAAAHARKHHGLDGLD